IGVSSMSVRYLDSGEFFSPVTDCQSVSITFAKRGRKAPMIASVDAMQRVKMADVARRAGVSVATVSKVVNGRYGVAQATIDRVQEVIDQLGYEASLGAQSLRSHRTNVLGILVAEFEPFSTELLKGASHAVEGTEYQLLAWSGGARGAMVGWERRSLARLSGSIID